MLTQEELESVVDQKVDIRTAFEPKRVFYTLFREDGINDRLRGGIWINLLDAYNTKIMHGSTFFEKLVAADNNDLHNKVTKDNICERSDILISKTDQTYLKPDPDKMKRVIIAYGNCDIEMGYNQGYNFLITIMLNYIQDEEDVFWCMHKLMLEQNWREMYCTGMQRGVDN